MSVKAAINLASLLAFVTGIFLEACKVPWWGALLGGFVFAHILHLISRSVRV